MARFYGRVFYEDTVSTIPGVQTPKLYGRYYYGDITRAARRYESGDLVNQNLTLSHEVSILADPYAFENYALIKCVEIDGYLWAANYVEVNRPRIKITIGGLYTEHPQPIDEYTEGEDTNE